MQYIGLLAKEGFMQCDCTKWTGWRLILDICAIGNGFWPEELQEVHLDQECERTIHHGPVDAFGNPVLGRRVRVGGIQVDSFGSEVGFELGAEVLTAVVTANLLQRDTVGVLHVSLISLEVFELVRFGFRELYDCPL